MKIAQKFKEADKNVNFAVSAHDDFGQELSAFGIDSPGDKPVIAAKDSSDQKFVMTEEFR